MRGRYSDSRPAARAGFRPAVGAFVLPLAWFFVGVFAEENGVADLAERFARC